MKFYSLPTLAQGEADTTFGDAGPKSGFLHILGCDWRGAGGMLIHIRRPNVYRRVSRQATRYKPYLATACRMRAPHGTQIAARKPTVAAPCRQSHGRPAAYAATMAGQVMGST